MINNIRMEVKGIYYLLIDEQKIIDSNKGSFLIWYNRIRLFFL